MIQITVTGQDVQTTVTFDLPPEKIDWMGAQLAELYDEAHPLPKPEPTEETPNPAAPTRTPQQGIEAALSGAMQGTINNAIRHAQDKAAKAAMADLPTISFEAS